MRHLSVLLLPCLLFAAAGIEPVVRTGNDGMPETYFRINTGNGYANPDPLPAVHAPALRSDTGVLWVDRNHRYAIVAGTAISGDGRHILSNWYLNAQRASYYRTLGDETPIWESPGDFTWAYNGRQLGCSDDGSVMGISSVNDCRKWSRNSPLPDWVRSYPMTGTGYVRVSHDGQVVAAAQGSLVYALDAQTGETLWTAPFSEGNRLQGLDISTDGSIIAVTVYDSCMVYENGVRRGQVPIGTTSSGTQYAAAISGDGSRLVTGDFQGRLKLWYYDSEAYVLRWQAQVGNPWVAGVGISRDGSTVACGTGYSNGKLCVFDTSSATPLWVYQNYGSYGAYVVSVALSSDGSRIAAASWGDTALVGTFRVFTVHNRSDTTPLVAITRDMEPGSLFACDISDDGVFAACGGKAVHAYRFGNGGETYAVMVGSSEAVNVGIHTIASPTPHIEVGLPVTPVAMVRNYGDSTAAVPAHLWVYDSYDSLLYHDSTVTLPIGPNEMAEATFTDFTAGHYDRYRFRFYTALVGDQFPGDDTFELVARCFHDVASVRIRPPVGDMGIGLGFQPGVVVRNQGSYTDPVVCFVTITDSAGGVVYSDSTLPISLAPEDTSWQRLASWTPAAVGPHTATAWTRVADDLYPANDTLRLEFNVTYEIMYDDYGPEAYYWVGRNDNDKFYVRFTPTIPAPFRLTHGRIMVNLANTPFDYVMVCPGSGNKPDTLNPLQIVNNVSAPVAPGWIDFDLDITRIAATDVWVVLHWPPSSPALGVGADATAPVDMRSYFSSNQDTFRLWTTHDWMVRLLQSPEVGVAGPAPAEPLRFGLNAPAPNPFSASTRLGFDLPLDARIELAVFDRTGRRVSVLASGAATAGHTELAWSGTDREGRPLAPGIYFVRLRNQDSGSTSTRKLTLTR